MVLNNLDYKRQVKKGILDILKSQKIDLYKNINDFSLEKPKNEEFGDYAFPCFELSRILKKNPNVIAEEIAQKLIIKKLKGISKIIAVGPYINFKLDNQNFSKIILKQILSEKENFGRSFEKNKKTVVIDMSSPNIAKPFGIGHLRSTIIGNSISRILEFKNYKSIKLNYLGDWGTQFGKLIVGYKHFGDKNKLKKDPINYLLELYIRSNDEKYEAESRDWFKKLEEGDKETLKLWKKFRALSIKEFKKIYDLIGIEFDVISGESEYNNKMNATIKYLKEKNLLEKNQGAMVVNLEKYNLGVSLIQKSDGATLYATRDITAAIDRVKKYHADRLIYEVGSEQKLHFNQFFKILELMGFKWAKDCIHISHGLYLDSDGKKFSTRKGKTVFMRDILNETIEIAKKEIKIRHHLSEKEVQRRAEIIARAAIFFGDLKNYRENNMVFDIDKFLSFEGDTGPYLLYTYARANSILNKLGKKLIVKKIDFLSPLEEKEISLIKKLNSFQEIIDKAEKDYDPSAIAMYCLDISHLFNEFYHLYPILNAEDKIKEKRIFIVQAFSYVLKNALYLLGIETLEEM